MRGQDPHGTAIIALVVIAIIIGAAIWLMVR
jgi:hypothetical protein